MSREAGEQSKLYVKLCKLCDSRILTEDIDKTAENFKWKIRYDHNVHDSYFNLPSLDYSKNNNVVISSLPTTYIIICIYTYSFWHKILRWYDQQSIASERVGSTVVYIFDLWKVIFLCNWGRIHELGEIARAAASWFGRCTSYRRDGDVTVGGLRWPNKLL